MRYLRFFLLAVLMVLGGQIHTAMAQPVKTLVVKPTTPEDDSKANSDSIPEVFPIFGEFDQIVVLKRLYMFIGTNDKLIN